MLQNAIATARELALPHAGGGWILRTDASQAIIARVLLLKQTNVEVTQVERVMGYFSRQLSGAETQYRRYTREVLAIRELILHCRYYINGEIFVCYTDHAVLRCILLQQSLSTRHITHLQVLHAFDFTIKYWQGVRNVVADAISRRADYIEE
jgi:hypothetical protein